MNRGSIGRRLGGTVILFLVLVALLSPLLATDRPLVARRGDRLVFPAFSAWPAAMLDRWTTPAPVDKVILRAPVPHSPSRTNLRARLTGPGAEHPLGTDELGRDLLSRLIHGTRVSLGVGFAAAAFSFLIGVLLGGIAGFFGGWIDLVLGRLIDVFLAFPFLVLLLAIVSVLQPGVGTIILALALTSWTAEARLVRGEILRVRETDYAMAARATGAPEGRILFRHLIPNALAPVLVTASFGVGGAILAESAISFLGFGIPLPLASWGTILSSADDYLREAWWLAVFPGLAIFLVVAACNLLGEGMRDLLDPRETRQSA
ncbi:MAG TPA: ABC transporter permease [Thermoanaerobaculia bacterium]|nr:ABC transporter permease [Thermoanaerobaculia bacterium]